MLERLIIAGFGGQGVLLIGKLLTHAGMKEGFNVSWIPSYGPEMRGGTANCTVILSDREIGSPIIPRPDSAIIMNGPSFAKFEPRVIRNGKLFVNSSMVKASSKRKDIEEYRLPANEDAKKIGNEMVANMVMLGAYLDAVNIVSPQKIIKVMKEIFPETKRKFIPLNEKAFHVGMEEAEDQLLHEKALRTGIKGKTK